MAGLWHILVPISVMMRVTSIDALAQLAQHFLVGHGAAQQQNDGTDVVPETSFSRKIV